MGKSPFLWGLIAAAVAGWFALQRYEIRGLKNLQFVRRDAASEATAGAITPAADRKSIRIASFNMETFGPSKVENLAVMDVVSRVIREFDIVALQEVCSPRPDILRNLLDRVNETGRHYSLVAGPHVGRTGRKEQYLFVFDQTTIETDRGATYTVDDPDDLLHHPPLVGWFRVRGAAPEKAFTFTLVNVHIDSQETQMEAQTLDDIFYEVRDDGRGEDDVIMLGDFNLDGQQLVELKAIPGLLAAITNAPTNTQQNAQSDNLLFQLSATSEYAGHSGVFDFMRAYNLTLKQALEVSDHLPVWAEFSTLEGGEHPAIVATPGNGSVR